MTERRMRRSRNWLEYTSTGVALVVSVISLWVAVRTEDANRRMVDANDRMVAAASWPFLQLKTGNASDSGDARAIGLRVENAGVGPAKIRTVEVFWQGRAFRYSTALLRACCAPPPAPRPETETQPLTGVIRAGETLSFLRWKLTPENRDAWNAFDRVRYSELTFRACYCSVFDECRVSDLRGREEAVKVCPKPAVPYLE